jgi:hypothetical protein
VSEDGEYVQSRGGESDVVRDCRNSYCTSLAARGLI